MAGISSKKRVMSRVIANCLEIIRHALATLSNESISMNRRTSFEIVEVFAVFQITTAKLNKTIV